MRILNIVETAYRGTLEEQDDTILWLSGALRNSGADVDILLRGNTVNYIVPQQCPALIIGTTGIRHPARPSEDLGKLQQKGVTVFAVREDLDARGITTEGCIADVKIIPGEAIAGLLEDYGQVWHW